MSGVAVQALEQAYQVLKDSQLREAYDLRGLRAVDIDETLFQNCSGARGSGEQGACVAQGEDLVAHLQVPFDIAAVGGFQRISAERTVGCHHCQVCPSLALLLSEVSSGWRLSALSGAIGTAITVRCAPSEPMPSLLWFFWFYALSLLRALTTIGYDHKTPIRTSPPSVHAPGVPICRLPTSGDAAAAHNRGIRSQNTDALHQRGCQLSR